MIERWFQRQKVPAIHRCDLESALKELGILDQIESGKTCCSKCGKPVNLDAIQCLFMENNQIKICCDQVACYEQVLFSKRIPNG